MIAKTESSKGPESYEQKFAGLVELCHKLKCDDVVTIATPHALGDSYDEIIESLNRIADTEAMLLIVPRASRRRVEREMTVKQDKRRRR